MHAAALILAVASVTAAPDSTDRRVGAYVDDTQYTEPERWDFPPTTQVGNSVAPDELGGAIRTSPPARVKSTRNGVRSADYRVENGGGVVRQAQFVDNLTAVPDERDRNTVAPRGTHSQVPNAAGARDYIPPSVNGYQENIPTTTAPPVSPNDVNSYTNSYDASTAGQETLAKPPVAAGRATRQENWNYTNINNQTVPQDAGRVNGYDRNKGFVDDGSQPTIRRPGMTQHVASQRDGTVARETTLPGRELANQPLDGGVLQQPMPAPTDLPATSDTRDAYRTTSLPTTTAARPTLPETQAKAPKAGTYFFTLLALFASIGMNLYLGWIAWDTYNRYQDLVADMRHATSRRERPDRAERDEQEGSPRRNRRLAEAY